MAHVLSAQLLHGVLLISKELLHPFVGLVRTVVEHDHGPYHVATLRPRATTDHHAAAAISNTHHPSGSEPVVGLLGSEMN